MLYPLRSYRLYKFCVTSINPILAHLRYNRVVCWHSPLLPGSKVLNKVELPYVPHEECQKKLQREMEFDFDLDTSFMCAGGEKGIDACKGDGGAPLVCRTPSNSRKFFQIGIVSWGLGCGLQDVPGVYTDVSVMQSWIRTELGRRNITIDRSWAALCNLSLKACQICSQDWTENALNSFIF